MASITSKMNRILKQVRTLLVNPREVEALAYARGEVAAASTGYTDSGRYWSTASMLGQSLQIDYNLNARYLDYEQMAEYPEICAALNIIADDTTQPDSPTNRRIWVESPNETVKEVLNDFLHRTIQIERHLWVAARTLALYGNVFWEITLGPSGVVDVRMLPTPTMRRIEGPRGELFGFIQDFQGRQLPYTPREYLKLLKEQRGGDKFNDQPDTIKELEGGVYSSVLGRAQAIAFENWQVVHMRLLSDGQRHVYGLAAIDGARWAWRRLTLMEDASLLYRIQRAPERFAYYIPTGTANGPTTIRMLHYARQQLKKKRYVNSRTGELDLRFNILAPDEDIFLPVPEGQEPMRVEQLTAPSWQNVEDLEYFLDKLYASIGVPRSYISQEDPNKGQPLSGVNVRFARSVLRVQHELTQGVHRVCRVELASHGLDPDSVEFDVRMPIPSSVYELAQMEVRSARADLITRYRENMSLEWCWENIEGMNAAQIAELKEQRRLESTEAGRNLGEGQAETNQAMGLRPDGQFKEMVGQPMQQESAGEPPSVPTARRFPDVAQDESSAGITQRHPFKPGSIQARIVQNFDVISSLHRQMILNNPKRTQATLDGILQTLREQNADLARIGGTVAHLKASSMHPQRHSPQPRTR